eukprot:1430144-Prymnesium_polylepis.1
MVRISVAAPSLEGSGPLETPITILRSRTTSASLPRTLVGSAGACETSAVTPTCGCRTSSEAAESSRPASAAARRPSRRGSAGGSSTFSSGESAEDALAPAGPAGPASAGRSVALTGLRSGLSATLMPTASSSVPIGSM